MNLGIYTDNHKKYKHKNRTETGYKNMYINNADSSGKLQYNSQNFICIFYLMIIDNNRGKAYEDVRAGKIKITFPR